MTQHELIAEQAVRMMVGEAIGQTKEEGMVLLFDRESELARTLVSAYIAEYPWAQTWEWNPEALRPEEMRLRFHALPKGTLVILVQSTNFRLDAFRIRLELFSRGLRTIEHVHLARMRSPEEQLRYLEACTYGPKRFTTQATRLQEEIRKAKTADVFSHGGEVLRWNGELEEPLANTGNYEGKTNVGGTFPVGEVFTEAKELACVSGDVRIFAMANARFEMEFFTPFRVRVKAGEVVLQGDEPEGFVSVIKQIQESERALVRELGFGLNPAFGKQAYVEDVTAFERQLGVHLSIGEKHSVYQKASVKKRDKTRFHVDVFVDVERVVLGDETIYEEGQWL